MHGHLTPIARSWSYQRDHTRPRFPDRASWNRARPTDYLPIQLGAMEVPSATASSKRMLSPATNRAGEVAHAYHALSAAKPLGSGVRSHGATH